VDENRAGHLRGDFESAGQSGLQIFHARKLDARRGSNGENFVHNGLDNFARVFAGSNLSILRAAKRGDRVERAIPNELGPQLAVDIFGDAARNSGALESAANLSVRASARTDDKIARPTCLTCAGSGTEAAT